jgi:hypothetical protein
MAQPDMMTKAIRRMIAVLDRAIRQVRHTGVPDEAGFNFTEAGTSSARRPQK